MLCLLKLNFVKILILEEESQGKFNIIKRHSVEECLFIILFRIFQVIS
ncbi:hypothetical protein SAMN05444672_103202 [Bacillus sp. OK838]|nr:hypothetical protein SAMN05444672_103202 [Bacillus sp. OK838]